MFYIHFKKLFFYSKITERISWPRWQRKAANKCPCRYFHYLKQSNSESTPKSWVQFQGINELINVTLKSIIIPLWIKAYAKCINEKKSIHAISSKCFWKKVSFHFYFHSVYVCFPLSLASLGLRCVTSEHSSQIKAVDHQCQTAHSLKSYPLYLWECRCIDGQGWTACPSKLGSLRSTTTFSYSSAGW